MTATSKEIVITQQSDEGVHCLSFYIDLLLYLYALRHC